MNTCKTCKWWEKSKWPTEGFCRNPKLDFLLQIDRVKNDSEGNPIGTHPDFGCIYHEPK